MEVAAEAPQGDGRHRHGPADRAEHGDDRDAVAVGQCGVHHRAGPGVAGQDLALKNAGSEKVTALAEKIKAAQDPEIKTMEGWLTDWGQTESTSSDDMGGTDHGSDTKSASGMSGMGMMSDQEMGDLETATGSEFDKMFLEMMVEHHKGAIEMAMTERSDGQNADAKALADKIITAQKGEITEMQALLDGGV